MLNTDKELKLYYSIAEVADMFGVNASLLRFWEKEFPQISPRTTGRGIRQYRKEDVETIGLIYHLVKERGMTLPGARQRMKDNKENTLRNFEIVRCRLYPTGYLYNDHCCCFSSHHTYWLKLHVQHAHCRYG